MTGFLATSEDQRRAFSRGETPGLEEVRPGVLTVALEMPGGRPGYSLCYVVDGGDGAAHLIDGGLDSAENRLALERALAFMGRSVGDVATVTVTHLHADHAQTAGWVRSASGASIRMHRIDARAARTGAPFMGPDAFERAAEEWAVPDTRRDGLREAARRPATRTPGLVVDEALGGGERLSCGSRELEVRHTPGHTGGHVVLALHDEGIVFTGDHVLPAINPGVGLGGRAPGDRPLADYLGSLRAVSALDAYEACPGHGFRFSGLGERCAEIAAHHARRTEEVARVLHSDPGAPVWEVASRLSWSAGWQGLEGFLLLSALAQTAMHMQACAEAGRASTG